MNAFAQLCESARSNGLKWILIGGHAVSRHGYGRMTEDVDFLINRDQKADWHRLVEEAGYTLFHDGGNFSQWQAPDDSVDELDFMIVSESTFAKLDAASLPSEYEGVKMPIPKLEHLLALKFHAMKGNKALRVLKDMDDVVRLIMIHGLNIHDDELKGLILKYGGPDLFEKLNSVVGNE